MLSDRCPIYMSFLSVTLVYCGQTVGRIKMKLGTQVGLGPGHNVLNGAAHHQQGTQPPIIGMHVRSGQTVGWIKMPLGMEVGLSPGDIVLDGAQKMGTPPPIFGPRPLWLNGRPSQLLLSSC